MKLHDYLLREALDDEAFGIRVGSSASAVKKWRYSQRTPRTDQMIRIREATDGAVTPNDFLPPRVGADVSVQEPVA